MAHKARKQKAVARRGLMLVLSSPSGAGKTTLSRMLLKADPNIELSVSVTTRPQRRGEKNGRDYHFIDRARFDAMVEKGELMEWAEVFGYHYGTPRRPVERALRAGRDVLFDIDWQGTQQLSEKARGDIASIFVLPPSIPELERRLHTRALDDKDVIRRRMAKASGELSHWAEYDYVIINDALDHAFAEVTNDFGGRAHEAHAAAVDIGLRAAAAGEALEHDPEKWIPVFGKDHAPLKCQHGAADDAAGAQIVERGLRLAERPFVGRDRRDFSGARQFDQFASLRQSAGQRAFDGHGLDREHGSGHCKRAAEQSRHHDLAAAGEHAGARIAASDRSRRSRKPPARRR